jgi:hypothetical protein
MYVSGDRIFMFLYDTDIETHYQILIDRVSQSVIYSREYNTPYNNMGVVEAYKNVWVLGEWPDFTCEGDLFYPVDSNDDVKTTIIWENGSSVDVYGPNGAAWTWAGVDAGGNHVSWFSVNYDSDDQLWVNVVERNVPGVTQKKVGGFTSTPVDSVYVNYDWHYDTLLQKPVWVIWNNDDNSSTSKILAMSLTGEFNTKNVISFDRNVDWDNFNQGRGGYHIYDVNPENNMLTFKTLDPRRLTFDKQFAISNNAWDYWSNDWTAYGAANQRIMFVDFTTDKAYSINERGLAGTLEGICFYGGNLAMSYSFNFDGVAVNMDTMDVLQNFDSAQFNNVCDGDQQVDRYVLYDCALDQPLCINGSVVAKLKAGTYTAIQPMYNDILRWHD